MVHAKEMQTFCFTLIFARVNKLSMMSMMCSTRNVMDASLPVKFEIWHTSQYKYLQIATYASIQFQILFCSQPIYDNNM